MPGRASSLASIGLLLALSVLVGALGFQPGAGPLGNMRAVTPPGAGPWGAQIKSSKTHDPSKAHDPKGPKDTGTTIGPVVTQSFRCPLTIGSAGETGTRQLRSKEAGSIVFASTFCRESTWYVSERATGFSTFVAKPFQVPDDPPIPASVTVERFVPLGRALLPAVLVEREVFPGASLYELFTLVGRNVEPMLLSPGGSPVLLLRASSQLQGAGFWCSETPSGEVIRQYEWYVVNPTTLETTPDGKVLGDPSVFFQTTVYTVDSADRFTDLTLATTTRGYMSAKKLSDNSC